MALIPVKELHSSGDNTWLEDLPVADVSKIGLLPSGSSLPEMEQMIEDSLSLWINRPVEQTEQLAPHLLIEVYY